MKRIFLMILLLIFFISCQKKTENIYDAVVVGGGLAGLSAAYHLKNELGENAKIILLEKENRLGGRILTRKFGEYSYELGATFGYSPTLVPKNFELPEMIVAPNSYGEYQDGKLEFSNKMYANFQFLTSESNMLGNKKQYGTYEYFCHRIGGNGEMIRAYESELEGKFILGAEVVSVQNEGKNNMVRYKKSGKEEEIKAKSVIVATTASVASKIIKGKKEESENFLKSISYRSYSVVNILAKPEKQFDFAYIKSDNLVLFVVSYGNNVYSLYCYLSGKTENESVAFSKQRLYEMGILNEKTEILNIDSYFWKEEGRAISEETYRNFSVDGLNPLPGVFLAGDYTFWEEHKIPYGMPSAYFSGQFAAQKVLKYLKK